jgi:hypothetical protein
MTAPAIDSAKGCGWAARPWSGGVSRGATRCITTAAPTAASAGMVVETENPWRATLAAFAATWYRAFDGGREDDRDNIRGEAAVGSRRGAPRNRKSVAADTARAVHVGPARGATEWHEERTYEREEDARPGRRGVCASSSRPLNAPSTVAVASTRMRTPAFVRPGVGKRGEDHRDPDVGRAAMGTRLDCGKDEVAQGACTYVLAPPRPDDLTPRAVHPAP